jgi:outer membrane protein OmpA-like peptidoglycan-associated protein/opacity protein-like surface antigen
MKKIIIALTILAVAATASAQTTDHRNNLQLYGGGGIHTLLYNPSNGIRSIGFGPLFGLQYQYMFNHHWGLGLGVEGNMLNSSAKYNYGNKDLDILLPGAEYKSDVTTMLYNVVERQHVTNLSVPLQLIFRNPVSTSTMFQMGLGAAADIPLKSTYKVTGGTYTRTAFMSRTNVTYSDLPSHNLGRYSANKQHFEGNNELTNYYISMLADLGFVFNCSNSLGFYLGLYGKYSPANINPHGGTAQPMLDYRNVYTPSFSSYNVDKVHPFEFGVKIALRFGLGRDMDWREIKAAEEAAAAQAEAERQAALAQAEAERKAAEERAIAEAIAKEKAEAEARAKAAADSLAKAQAATEARLKAEAEARAKAEAEARRAEAEARERARAEQRAREEAAFVAGYRDVAYFETGKDMPIFSELNEDSWDNLKAVMDKHPEIKVTVTGHTDNVGKDAANLKLSQNRADNIKKMLVLKGIAADRITAIGKGESEPVETNSTPEGRAKNRRIEITIGK